VLVDVKNDRESFRVEKSGDELRIRVVSPEQSVDVSLPIESVQKIVGRLDA
jgi:hypothetical protein